ncbi:hypothetical protein B0A48_18708 [Cryoendolithus antarcticus]|uniref:Uncharacterized protein n=1 Tax=Cryoendolithus antarcticus TaxID=1507870 RepID=A0A1V8S8J2_9PEZI|nr:hypothetical protein B0A48_18708 [Cryoendolithus antarcticus]
MAFDPVVPSSRGSTAGDPISVDDDTSDVHKHDLLPLPRSQSGHARSAVEFVNNNHHPARFNVSDSPTDKRQVHVGTQQYAFPPNRNGRDSVADIGDRGNLAAGPAWPAGHQFPAQPRRKRSTLPDSFDDLWPAADPMRRRQSSEQNLRRVHQRQQSQDQEHLPITEKIAKKSKASSEQRKRRRFDTLLDDSLTEFASRDETSSLPNNLNPGSEFEELTRDDSLCRLLKLFPDIAQDYVAQLYDANAGGCASTKLQCMVDDILSRKTYPKQSESESVSTLAQGLGRVISYDPSLAESTRSTICKMIKAEFPDWTLGAIQDIE